MKRLDLTKKAGPVAALGLAAALVLANGSGGTRAQNEEGQFAKVSQQATSSDSVSAGFTTVESNADEFAFLVNDPAAQPLDLGGVRSNEATSDQGDVLRHDPASVMSIFTTGSQESATDDVSVVVHDPASVVIQSNGISTEAESVGAGFVSHDPAQVAISAPGTAVEADVRGNQFVQRDVIGLSEALGGGPTSESEEQNGAFVRHGLQSVNDLRAGGLATEAGEAQLPFVQQNPSTLDVFTGGSVTTESESRNGIFVQDGNRVMTIELEADQLQLELIRSTATSQGAAEEEEEVMARTQTSDEASSGVVRHDPTTVTISVSGGPTGEADEADGNFVMRDLISAAEGLGAVTQESEADEAGGTFVNRDLISAAGGLGATTPGTEASESESEFIVALPSWFGSGEGMIITTPAGESDAVDASFVQQGGANLSELDLAEQG
jgi:hypothetical protein